MSVRILYGRYDAGPQAAVLVDSVTEVAFGPLFNSAHEAEDFLVYLKKEHGLSARGGSDDDLCEMLEAWREERGRAALEDDDPIDRVDTDPSELAP